LGRIGVGKVIGGAVEQIGEVVVIRAAAVLRVGRRAGGPRVGDVVDDVAVAGAV